MVICALGVLLASNPRAMRTDQGGETLTGVEWVTGKGFESSWKTWSSSGSSSLLGLEEEDDVEEEACWGSSSQKKKMKSRWCSPSVSISGDAPARLRRGRASMVRVEEEELLHGFARERGCLGRVGGRERESRGVLGR